MDKNYEHICGLDGLPLHWNSENTIFICLELKHEVEIKDGLRGEAKDANGDSLDLAYENNEWKIKLPLDAGTRSITEKGDIKTIQVEMKPLIVTMDGKHPI